VRGHLAADYFVAFLSILCFANNLQFATSTFPQLKFAGDEVGARVSNRGVRDGTIFRRNAAGSALIDWRMVSAGQTRD
jgi:hypothetical protein